MSKTYIDYDKLMISAKNLTNSVSEFVSSTKILKELELELKSHSKQHDNCISISSGDIENKMQEIKQNIANLINGLEVTVDVFSEVELLNPAISSITSVGLDNVLKMQLNKTYGESLEGYDYDKYQEMLNKRLKSTSGTRGKSVAAALFLATSFPHMNYFWGGGHKEISTGLDPTWGTPTTVTAGGSDTTGTKQPNSLDCSGYVSWALKNGGYDIEKPMVTGELETIGEKVAITDVSTKGTQVGDLAYMDGHVGMIVSKQKNNITISHCSGSGEGMNMTTINTKTGLVISDATNQERVGKPYFTDIIKVDYKD